MKVSERIQDQKRVQTWPKVAVVVLNWNGWRDTIECLESLDRIIYPNFFVIIVDNGSTNDSVDRIKAWMKPRTTVEPAPTWAPNLTPLSSVDYSRDGSAKLGDSEEHSEDQFTNQRFLLICNRENIGFAAGCNSGIRRAISVNCQYVLLLNNDTVVAQNFLSAMVSSAEKCTEVGIVGSKVYYADGSQRIWYAGGKISLLKPGGISYGKGKQDICQYNRMQEVTFVTGAVMLVKREVFSKIGMLDECFFFGIEDYDFCRRAMKMGYRLLYIPEAVVWHKVGASRGSGTVDIYRGYKSSIIYMKKYLSLPAWILWFLLYAFYALAISPYRRCVTVGKADRRDYRRAVIRALREGWLDNRVCREDIENARSAIMVRPK